MPNVYEKSGIYKIINLTNNKVYIGSAIDISHRFACHKYDLKNNRHHSNHLQKAYNKYGLENFKFEILFYCDEKLLISNEQNQIDLYKSYLREFGYNINPKAENSLGIKHTKESKLNMSKAHIGIKMPPFTDSHKNNLRISHLNCKKKNRRPIISININTLEVVKQYSSLLEASREGYSLGCILKVCQGKRKTHKKLLWRYV